MNKTTPSSAFVNRRQQLKDAYKAFYFNILQEGGYFRYPIVNQEFGTGKTSFADNLFNFSCEHISSAFQEFFTEHGNGELPSHVLGFEYFAGWTLMDYFKSAVTVSIRLDNIRNVNLPANPASKLPYLMWVNALQQLYKIGQQQACQYWDNNQSAQMCTDVVECYMELLKLTRTPIFFYIDEVQEFENWLASSFLEPPAGLDNMESGAKAVVKQKLIIQQIAPALRGGALFMAVGKSTFIYDVDLNFTSSPCKRYQILLSTFSCADIKDVLKSKMHLGMSVYDYFGFKDLATHSSSASSSASPPEVGVVQVVDNLEEEFLEWFRDMTGGIPRFCVDGLGYLIEVKFHISRFRARKEELKRGLEEIMRRLYDLSIVVAQKGNPYYDAVVNLAVLGAEVTLDTNVFISELENVCSIRRLVERFCLYVKEVEVSENKKIYTIDMPWFMKERLVREQFVDATTFQSPVSYAAKGRALEVFCARRLQQWSAYCQCRPDMPLSQIWPWVQSTCFANVRLSTCSIVECSRLLDTVEAVEEMLLGMISKPTPSILLPPAKSSSPDLYTVVPTGDTYSSVLCVQCKNWVKIVTRDTLIADLKTLLHTCSVITTMADRQQYPGAKPWPRLPILYVLICTSGAEASLVNCVLDHNSELGIPEGVQVVVLSLSQVNYLLGEKNVAELRTMASV